MRKNRKQRKNRNSYQMELFSRRPAESLKGKPVESPTGGTGKEATAGDELLSLLQRERARTINIIERIVDYVNLNKASQQVIRNGGSGGIDGMETEGFRQWYAKTSNIKGLREDILNEQYKVSPVLKVEIPKPAGAKRMLGIPTLKDRFVQQAIHQQLNKH
jgi:RNA-directed DNA polymerase